MKASFMRRSGMAGRVVGRLLLAVVVILIVFVQAVQSTGDWLVRRLSHR